MGISEAQGDRGPTPNSVREQGSAGPRILFLDSPLKLDYHHLVSETSKVTGGFHLAALSRGAHRDILAAFRSSH